MSHQPKQSPKGRLLRKRLADATPLDAPVLCLIRTGNATGTNLVATLHTTLGTTLNDLRIKLAGIAATARSRLPLETAADQNLPLLPVASTPAGPKGPPVNYPSPAELEQVTTARLHAFDLTAPFRFVRRGGASPIARGMEAKLKLVDVIPLIPPYGLPTGPQWQSTPPYGTVVVKPTMATAGTAEQPPMLREAIVALFVAQGEFNDDMHSEKVVMERLLLQQQSYGRASNVKQLSAVLHKWNANTRDFLGRAPLHEYSFEGNYAAVKYLVSLPFVRLEERDAQGCTALHLATLSGQVDCVHALLDAGAQLLVSNYARQTPLHIALYRRHDALVDLFCRRLRQQGTPLTEVVKLTDSLGKHPVVLFKELAPSLDELVRGGNVDELRAMTRHYLFGAPTRALCRRRYFNNDSLLHVAARSGNDKVVRFLLDELKWMTELVGREGNADTALLDGSRRSPLHVAAMRGHTQVVRQLVAAMGVAMCAKPDVTGNTPLMHALARKHVATAQFLVETVADVGVDCINRLGLTALHMAVGCGAVDVGTRLVSRFGANVDAHTTTTVVTKRRMTNSASRPVTSDRQELLRFARSVRAKYNRLRRRRPAPLPVYERSTRVLLGPTPLWCAVVASVAYGPSAASLLLSHGAGTSFMDDAYLPSLLKHTLRSKHLDLSAALVRLMGTAAASDATVLAHVCAHRDAYGTDCIRWLVDRKVGSEHAAPAIGACVRLGDLKSVKFLLDNTAALTTTSAEALLLEALSNKHVDVVQEFVRRGAPLTNVEEDKAPLVVAARLGLESVVRGLAALPAIATFDAVTALVALLRAAPSRRPLSVATEASYNAMAVSLLRKIMLTDAHVHPIELLHMTCGARLFGAAEVLAEKLSQLPSDARITLVKSAPNPPQRPTVTVTPAVPKRREAGIAGPKASKRKPLFKPLIPFERHVYVAPSHTVLLHRQSHRDAFSVLAEVGERRLIESLIVDVRISPWRHGDLRGWNATDYAIEKAHYDTAVVLVASGLLPLRPHKVLPMSKSGLLMKASNRAKAQTQRAGDTSAATSLRVLLEILAEHGSVDVLADLLHQLCVTLRQPTLQALPWMLCVARAAVLHHQVAPLKLIVSDFVASLSSPLSDGGEELMMCAVCCKAPAPIVDLLLNHGAPVHVPSPVSKPSLRKLKVVMSGTLQSTTKMVAATAAAALGEVETFLKLFVAAGPPTQLTPDNNNSNGGASHDVLFAAVHGARRSVTNNEAKLITMVQGALDAGCTSAHVVSAARLAAQRGFCETALVLIGHLGYQAVIADDVSASLSEALLVQQTPILMEMVKHRHASADQLLPLALMPGAPAVDSGGGNDDTLNDDDEGVAMHRRAVQCLRALAQTGMGRTLIAAALRNGHVQTSALLSVLGFHAPSGVCVATRSGGSKGHASSANIALCASLGRSVAVAKGNVEALLVDVSGRNHLPLVKMLLTAARLVGGLDGKSPVLVMLASSVASGAWGVLDWLIQDTERTSTKVAIASATVLQAMVADVCALGGGASRRLSILSQFLSIASDKGLQHLPASLWSVLSTSRSPLLGRCLASRALRKSIVLECEGLTFARITPIALAAALGDEVLLLQLVAAGANPACQHSELTRIKTQHGRRRALYGRYCASGKLKWTRSTMEAVDNQGCHSAAMQDDHYYSREIYFAGVEVCSRVSPILIATQRLAAASSESDLVRYQGVVSVLIRRGGLTRDVLNVVAIVAAKKACWGALVDIIEEGLRLSRTHDDSDRFFARVADKDVPLCLLASIGTARHVLHAACGKASRDTLILIARHCVRSDVESCQDAKGRTPLYFCVQNPQSVVGLETLCALQIPATMPCDTQLRRTPLAVASRCGNATAVAILLKFGGVNATDAHGNTPLMFAAASGKQDAVELLLAAEADSSFANDQGLTASMIAAARGFDAIALPLAQHFSRVASFVSPRTTLLHCAVLGGCQRLAEYILRTYDSLGIFQEDAAGMTPVYLAYAFGRGPMLRQMLAELQHRTESPTLAIDEQLLMCASRLHRFGWLSSTLNMGEALLRETTKRTKFSAAPFELVCGPVLRRLRSQRSRLLWCATNRCVVGVRVLADLNVCDDCFAIHEAAKRGSLDILQLLVALRMSDPNTRDSKGFLPVEHAILAKHGESASFLLQNMRVSVDTVYQSLQRCGTSILHLIAMSGCHQLLSVVVPKLLQATLHGGRGPAVTDARSAEAHGAETVLTALLSADVEGRTPFELAVLFGSAATTLRVAQAIQQVAATANTEATITLPSTLFELQPNFSPSVRAALYDFFDVEEVFSQSTFADTFNGKRKRHYRPGGDAGDRLLFGDVRIIGVASMRQDAFCAPKLEQVYTVDRERHVLKQLTKAMDLPFRLKFRPEGLKGLTPAEQVAVLQRLSASTLLGKYIALPPKLHPIGTLELDLAASRSDVSVTLEGSTVVERFLFTKNTVVVVDLYKALMEQRFADCRKELNLMQGILRRVVQFIRSLPHPMLKALILRVDWNGLHLHEKDVATAAAVNDPSGANAESGLLLGTRTRMVGIATNTIKFVNTAMLPVLENVLCSERLLDLLQGIPADALAGADHNTIQSITLRCYESVQQIPQPVSGVMSSIGPILEGHDIVIPFLQTHSATGEAIDGSGQQLRNVHLQRHINDSIAPLVTAVRRDVIALEVQRLRDRFVAALERSLSSKRGHYSTSSPLRFKLETEGIDVDQLPVHMFAALLEDALAAVDSIVAHAAPPPPPPSLSPADSTAASSSKSAVWKGLTSSRLIAQSVASGINSVIVLFTSKRQHVARRSGNRLMLCFTPTLAPCFSEIEASVRSDTVELELEKLKEQIPHTVNDMSQRLNTYLPTTSLVVDLPSLMDLPSDEDVLASLALLNYDRSAVVLQEIIRGISIGWDTKLGSLVRRHVRQLSLTLQRSGANATVSLLPNGNLVVHYPLQCVENARGRMQNISSWSIPSSQQIASLMLMQLASMHAEVKQLVDVTKGYACWCRASGLNSRQVVAGDVRCGFVITVRNVLNAVPQSAVEETFEFVSSKRMPSLRVVRNSKSTSHNTYHVRFSAPTRGGVFPLAIRLHGHHVLNSPLQIRVLPAACSPAQTTCLSKFNTMVARQSTRVLFQLHDRFGNALTHTPNDLRVEGPSLGNPDGVCVTSWSSKVPGIVAVQVEVDVPGAEVPISVRFELGVEHHVAMHVVEVVSQETYEKIVQIRGARGDAAVDNGLEAKKIRDKAKLFFRASVRDAERTRRQRACRLVGGVRHRRFPSARSSMPVSK